MQGQRVFLGISEWLNNLFWSDFFAYLKEIQFNMSSSQWILHYQAVKNTEPSSGTVPQMDHSTDYFRSLLFPNRAESLIVPIVSLGPVACAITLTMVDYNYNYSVNHYTTLLTKFDNWILCLYIASIPIHLLDLLRFSTGMVIHPWICSFSSYYDYFIIEIFLEVITVEAFFHYLFIRKQSDSIFLVIKENLLSRIILRSVMVVGICNISYKFYKKQKMPKAYYICAGEKPPFITKDCDSHQDQYGIFTLILYILIYFIYSILMLIERRKISISKDQQPRNEKSKRTGLNLSGQFENNMNTGKGHIHCQSDICNTDDRADWNLWAVRCIFDSRFSWYLTCILVSFFHATISIIGWNLDEHEKKWGPQQLHEKEASMVVPDM